jgi:N-acetylneuraminic acid mutarotase
MSRSSYVGWLESLEARRLMHAVEAGVAAEATAADFHAHVNFQPPRVTVPAGYVADTGAVFADRGNGYAYGWNDTNTAYRDRNNSLSPDQRYDTFTHTQLYGTRTWELAVPAGAYSVRIVAGDPSTTNSVYGFSAEGVSVVAGKPTSTSRWIEGTKTVTVTDGRLTVSNSAAAVNNKLAFVEVAPAAEEPEPPAAVSSWATGTPSPVARFESASASIGGKLYVFGGYDKNIQAMSRSDVYDPAADRWSPIAPMPQAITHAGVATDGGAVYFAGGFVGERSFVTTANVWKYDASANAWSAFTPLPESRAAGGLVLLGRELHFFGGASAMHTKDYADHWVLNLDAAPGTAGSRWTSAAPLPNARNHFGYAALGGKMYAIGGQHFNNEKTGNLADVDAYDPDTGQWSSVAPLPVARSHNHTSTVVLNGRVYLFGGQANDPYFPKTIADVTSYDPATNTWTALPPLPDVRQATAAQAIGNRIYVTTGTNTGIHPQTTTWSKDFGATWDVGPSMPVSLGEVAGGVIGGKMYVVGSGNGATLSYDFAAGTWSSATALAQRPFKGDHHAAEVVNGKLYLFGGLGAGSEGKVQVYDPATNRWSLAADMPFAVGSSSSAAISGRVYVAGGIIGSTSTSRAARYDPAKNTWTELPPMPAARNHAASGTDGRRFYIFGGRGPGSGDSNTVANGFDTVQIYDPVRNVWLTSDAPAGSGAATGSTLRPLPQARGGTGKALFYRGNFYVMGGETLTGAGATLQHVYDRVDVYNPLANTWRLAAPMPTARHGVFPLLYAGRAYLPGGGIRSGNSSSAVLEVLNLQ